jgi:hypothetical protein
MSAAGSVPIAVSTRTRFGGINTRTSLTTSAGFGRSCRSTIASSGFEPGLRWRRIIGQVLVATTSNPSSMS